ASGKLLRQISPTSKITFPRGFSPDGSVLATSSTSQDKKSIRLWQTATGKELRRLAWEDDTILDTLAISRDGNYLVSGHRAVPPPIYKRKAESCLRLWDIARGRVIHNFQGLPAHPQQPPMPDSIAISPDGKTVAAGGSGPNWMQGEPGIVLLWEMASGKERGRFTGHQSA